MSISKYLFIVLVAVLLLPTTSDSREITLMELEEVTDLIMSPGCNYIYTLTNCPSEEAKQMREIVKDKLSQGETKEAILNYFEEIYGPRVLAQPKKKGFYFVAWWFPYFLIFDIFLLIGLILFLWQKKGSRAKKPPSVTNSSEDSNSDDYMERLLEDEVRRFRQ
jgi:cytochrome c-type biogenesis protein CcmH